MLQKFNDNLLYIQDEPHLKNLQDSSEDVAKKLHKNKAKILSFVLAALDTEIPADNAVVVEVKETISKGWKTFSAIYKDTPVNCIRAVIFEALKIISKEPNLACLIWLSSQNIQRYFKLGLGKEKDIVTNFILELGNKIEQEAVKSWLIPSELELQKFDTELRELTGQPNESLEHQTEITKVLVQIQDRILTKTNLLQMRTQLLWWKEACYSTSLGRSYRDLCDGILQISLANDYSNFIPPIYPKSADYFLKEAHRALVDDENKRVKVSEMFSLIEASKPKLKAIFAEPSEENSRIPLLNFIKGFVWSRYNIEQFKDLVGFSDSTELTLAEFTLWIFHDLQSLKILNSK